MAVDQQNAAAALEDARLTAGGIAQRRKIWPQRRRLGLEENFVGPESLKQFHMHLKRDGLPDIRGSVLHDKRQVGGLGDGCEIILHLAGRQTGQGRRDSHECIIAGGFRLFGPGDGLRRVLRTTTGEDWSATRNDFRNEMR